VDEQGLKATLLKINATLCKPPLSESEVNGIAASVSRYPTDGGRSLPDESAEGEFVCLNEIESEEVQWLWHPYIPLGNLTLAEGDPNVGKSWVTLAILSAITRGEGLHGMRDREPQEAILLTAEDGLGDTVRPRLESLEADLKRVHVFTRPFVLDRDGLSKLEAQIDARRPALVVLDPLVAYMGTHLDINKANDMRSLTAALASLAGRKQCAIVAVRHLTKGNRSRSLYRGTGSIDICAAARSILLVGRNEREGLEDQRALVQIKNNLAPIGPSIGYSLTADIGFRWTGVSQLTASQLLGRQNSEQKRAQARTLLQEELKDGGRPVSAILEEGKKGGISEKTIRRAKKDLNIESRRVGSQGRQGGGAWHWELPGHQDTVEIAAEQRLTT
jgi:hypothetical protein